MTYLELSQLFPNSTLDVLELHNSQINTDTPGNILLEMFHKCSRNPGVIVSNGEGIVAIISRKLFLEYMSHAYSLELYLRRPIQLYLNVFKTYFFQLPSICTIEQAVKLALSRPVNLVYEPIVVINEEQKVSLLDIYVLLLAQSQILLKTNTLIQQQQQQKQVYLELLERQQAELQQSKEELIESEERYHRLVEFSPETIAVHKERKFEYINVAGAKLLGAANPDELIGKSIWNFVCPSEREMVKARVQMLQAKEDYAELIEGKFLRLDGQAIDVEVTSIPITYQGKPATQIVLRDVTKRKQVEAAVLRAKVAEATNQKLKKQISERKRVEAQLLHNSLHDILTSLPNRALFMDRLERSLIQTNKRKDCWTAILFLDLDRFKLVNDSLGHLVGDELLRQIACRLKDCLREEDTVSRFGGDEFTILLENIQDISESTQLAKRLQEELALPFILNKQEVFTAVSIGIALSSNCEQPEELLRNADIAMYRAKNLGRARYSVFDTAMHSQAVELLQLETDLRRAVERQEFHLYYQPIFSLSTGKISGFEALVRWQHPERGMISPTEFISLTEETGLIVPLGAWILYSACHQMRVWQQQFPTSAPLTISVNISGRQFFQPELVEQITQVLQQTGLDARSLKLEITENIIMENTHAATSTLQRLKALGVQLHMDDFGTGYSSLSYLRRFPIDTLKIDRSFVSQMGVDDENLAIVQTIVTLAHNLGMSVTAEGIQTAAQLALLQTMKCEFGQGYLFSEPVDVSEACLLIADSGVA